MRLLLFALVLALGGWSQTSPPDPSMPADGDGDGLPDTLEQALLQRFLPRFYISSADCDGSPSTFAPGEAEPRAIAREGRIYGQVFPAPHKGGRPRIEMHYFHLWSRDCGRLGHPLDIEHVAVLLEQQRLPEKGAASHPPASPPRLWEWRALYWFAAGHQRTVCDVSHAARADFLVAEWAGADVWISSGKHASYLSRERCRLGCGGDTCPDMQPLTVTRVVNLGEPGRPLNGSLFTASSRWPFASKMAPHFDQPLIEQLDAQRTPQIVAANRVPPPVRATILAGGETLDGLGTGSRHTGSALKTGKDSTGSALGRAFRSVKRALGATDAASSRSAAGKAADPAP